MARKSLGAAPTTPRVVQQATVYKQSESLSRASLLGQVGDVVLLLNYPLSRVEETAFLSLLERRLARYATQKMAGAFNG